MEITRKHATNWYYDFDGDGQAKHSQSFQNNKSAMSLKHLKKDIRDEVDFLHADKHQISTVGIIVFDGSDQTCPKYSK